MLALLYPVSFCVNDLSVSILAIIISVVVIKLIASHCQFCAQDGGLDVGCNVVHKDALVCNYIGFIMRWSSRVKKCDVSIR